MSAGQKLEPLRIELLGGFRVACGTHEIPSDGWRLAKARSLVKILALAPGQNVLRDQLVELLWPELDPESGANNLHQVLHVARRTLASVLPDAQPNNIIRLRRGILSLEPSNPVWIDVAAFERGSVDLAASSDPADFYPTLDLYRGDLLPDDLYEEWVADHRTALREQYLDLLSRLAGLHAERREATPAIDALRRLVAIEPDREDAHRALMELYALTGRRQQALRQYERVREVLERELDLEPEPETEELYESILAGDYPEATWDVEQPAEPAGVARPEITESIAEFLGRAGDFVGRSEELGKLQQSLERVIGGAGEIILVAGEPGIGKTRMSEEFLRYAGAQGVRTLWGRCYEGDGAPAYWPWVQIVRSYIEGRATAELRTVMGAGAADIARIAPELRARLPDLPEPPPLDPDGERFRLFDSMTTFLKNAAGRAPLALIIDDLHSADRSSLLLLEFLAREIAGTGLLILGTYRHVEVDRGHPLTRTLGQLARHEPNERITLDGLSIANIERYIALVTGREAPEGLAGAIHDQTEGNPFFVREIVALLIEEERLNHPEDVRSWRLTIPHGIRETIALRTARLSDTAHRVLTTASVSGRDFELPIVARVAGLDELDTLDALEEALGTGLILESPPTPGGFRFTHAITRETLYEDLSHSRRLRMHLRTGEAIEDLYADALSEQVTDLAYHYYVAAPVDIEQKAIGHLRRAGKQAFNRIAYSEAARYFQQSLEIAEQHASDDLISQCRLLLDLGEALIASGDSRNAVATYERAAEIARKVDAPELFGEAAVGISDAAFHLGEAEGRYLTILEQAAGTLHNHNLLVVQVLGALSRDFSRAIAKLPDAVDQAQYFADEALRIALELNQPEAIIVAREARQWPYSTIEEFENRLSNTDEILRLAAELGDHRRRLLGHAWRIFDYASIGEMELSERENNAYHAIAIELRQPNNLWAATFRQAMYSLLRGDFAEAEDNAARALRIGERCTPEQALEAYYTQLALIRREQGRQAEVLDLAREVADRHPTPSHYSILLHVLFSETGNLDEPLQELDRLRSGNFEEIPRNLLRLPNLAMLAVLTAKLHSCDAAEQLYELLLPYENRNVSGGGNVVAYGSAAHYLGLLSAVRRDWSRAERHLLAGIAANTRMGARPFVAHGMHALGQVMIQRDQPGDGDRGIALINEASIIASDLGMHWLLQQQTTERSRSSNPSAGCSPARAS